MVLSFTDSQPISKRRLSFNNDETGDIGVVGISTGHNRVSVKFQAKKRDCNEMFIPLSDGEELGCDIWDCDSGLCNTHEAIKHLLESQLHHHYTSSMTCI